MRSFGTICFSTPTQPADLTSHDLTPQGADGVPEDRRRGQDQVLHGTGAEPGRSRQPGETGSSIRAQGTGDQPADPCARAAPATDGHAGENCPLDEAGVHLRHALQGGCLWWPEWLRWLW